MLTAGTPRIDLDGMVAGEVTIEDEQDAQRKIAKAFRRAAAKQIEDRKAAAVPQPTAPAGPPHLGLSGLKAAARKAQLFAAE
jgi:sRNA-binding protein